MPVLLREYFLPEDGISWEVIQRDIAKYLGGDALIRRGAYQGRNGFFIKAYRTLTSEMIKQLQWDTTWRKRDQIKQRFDYNTSPETSKARKEPTLTQYGNVPVLVWSNVKNKWLQTDAVADTGSLGRDANLVSLHFLKEDLQHEFVPCDVRERVPFHGLGGTGYTLGVVKLKIQRIGSNQDNEPVRQDISRPTFFVHDSFPGDILFGREFLESNEASRPYWGYKGKAKPQPAADDLADMAELARRNNERENLRRMQSGAQASGYSSLGPQYTLSSGQQGHNGTTFHPYQTYLHGSQGHAYTYNHQQSSRHAPWSPNQPSASSS